MILSCSTGEGHNSAAHALEDVLHKMGVATELRDPVSFRSNRMQHVVSALYNQTIKKAPHVFGMVYKLGDLYSASNLPSPIYWANARYADALRDYIRERHFDAVLCTHLYGMEAMTAIKQDPEFKIPCYGILTDYTCIPFLEETRLDHYFVTHEEIREQLSSHGISEDQISVTGIPVSERFTNHLDQASAREQLGIPADQKMFLIMTGGIGCENMERLCEQLVRFLEPESTVYMMTGRNKKLKDRLDEKYREDLRVRTVAFTTEVALYMAAADVVLTKPGGLSSTEGAVANVPMVFLHAIPGCETCNARFYKDHGMALVARSNREAVAHATRLTDHREEAEEMQRRQRQFVPADAARRIVQEMMRQ